MATLERVTDQAKAGQGVGAESSTLKYYGTEMNKRRNELLMDCSGSDALEWDADGDAARHWLRSKGNSIEGGTSEVQLNIIAKRVLGLPST
jgi:acyl-CoA dehydrogenase